MFAIHHAIMYFTISMLSHQVKDAFPGVPVVRSIILQLYFFFIQPVFMKLNFLAFAVPFFYRIDVC